jgi:hypothetical protein
MGQVKLSVARHGGPIPKFTMNHKGIASIEALQGRQGPTAASCNTPVEGHSDPRSTPEILGKPILNHLAPLRMLRDLVACPITYNRLEVYRI